MSQSSPVDQEAETPSPDEKRLIIVLADLSGYTELMVTSQTAAVHGQMVVSMLIEAILNEVEIPLQLQEIEGDAVFLYAAHPGTESGWREVCEHVGRKLPRFFKAFAEAVVSMHEATLCSCAVCRNHMLRIKVIAHSGTAVFHSIRGRAQVSGVDVIKAHRLLKNSVPSNEYILLTEAAHQDLCPFLNLKFTEGEEQYENLGAIRTFVHFPSDYASVREKFYARSPAQLALTGFRYSTWSAVGGLKALSQQTRNPATQVGRFRRFAFAAFIVLATPFMLVLYPVMASVHLLRKQANQR